MENDYLNVVTSEYRDKAKARAFLKAKIDFIEDLMKCLAGMPENFDLDKAVGKQLDILGEIIGASRIVSVSSTEAFYLTDEDYKIYIKSKIAKNVWNGEIDSLQNVWYELFGKYLGIVDNQDMSINVYIIGNFSNNIIYLIKNHKIIPKPVGVKVNYYILKNRIFSYGWDNAIFTGYGGTWSSGTIQSDDDILAEKAFGLVNKNDEYESEGLDGFGKGIWRQ